MSCRFLWSFPSIKLHLKNVSKVVLAPLNDRNVRIPNIRQLQKQSYYSNGAGNSNHTGCFSTYLTSHWGNAPICSHAFAHTCILRRGTHSLLEIPTQKCGEQGFTSNCHVPLPLCLCLSPSGQLSPPQPSSSQLASSTIKSNPLLGRKITITMGHRPFLSVRQQRSDNESTTADYFNNSNNRKKEILSRGSRSQTSKEENQKNPRWKPLRDNFFALPGLVRD